jgi:hypothetical protein
MVQTYYLVKCQCSSAVQGYISSASCVDGLIGSNECMHCSIEVYCTTRLGWFFGANAKVDFRIFVTWDFLSMKILPFNAILWMLHASAA